MALWVDTDFGFDDLWAILVLASQNCQPDGISLVAGNTDLDRVCKNALAAARLFDLAAPIYRGAAMPLGGEVIRATAILGDTGMRAAGPHLPDIGTMPAIPDALDGLTAWLTDQQGEEKICIALGPLTNLALLAAHAPDVYQNLTKIIWMGGSAGPGNHSAFAEFNAMADPQALARLVDLPVPLQIVDLTLCRQVTITAEDIAPLCSEASNQPAEIFASLLTGYLDIARTRGRSAMAIYDPLAVASHLIANRFCFERCHINVETEQGQTYGQTHFLPDQQGRHFLAKAVEAGEVRKFCLDAVAKELWNV